MNVLRVEQRKMEGERGKERKKEGVKRVQDAPKLMGLWLSIRDWNCDCDWDCDWDWDSNWE